MHTCATARRPARGADLARAACAGVAARHSLASTGKWPAGSCVAFTWGQCCLYSLHVLFHRVNDRVYPGISKHWLTPEADADPSLTLACAVPVLVPGDRVPARGSRALRSPRCFSVFVATAAPAQGLWEAPLCLVWPLQLPPNLCGGREEGHMSPRSGVVSTLSRK